MDEPQPTYDFGRFRLDPARRVLWRDGTPVALAPKVLDTLRVLIEQRGRVVSKDELLERVWQGAVVEEGGLARNISLLRRALGEKPDDHHYVVTIPAQGYRFVADVQRGAAIDDGANVPGRPPTAAAASPRGERTHPVWFAAAVVAAIAAGALTYFLARAMPQLEARREPITALAVLPLDNLSGNPSEEYFADGMTEALIGSLARIRALRVVSRTSAMRFKGGSRPLSEIARMLNVDGIVEGSVGRTADRVRISVQLVHGATDTHLWAREYERELTDVLKLQADVARAVAEEINVQITAEERSRLASAGAVHPLAYQEYLLGQYYLWKLNEENLSRAIDHFERATRLDHAYAAAYAGLSHAWWWRGVHGSTTPKQVEQPSRAAARRALELDPRLAQAHVSAGRIKFNYEWDWNGAEKDFGRALELDPNNLDAHFFHGMLFMALGRFAEAIAHIERAEQLDPLSATVQSAFGRILYRAGRYDEAILHLNQAIELGPEISSYERLADVLEELGRYPEALAHHEKGKKLRGQQPIPDANIARIYARMGNVDEARNILATLQTSKPRWLSSVTAYVALGEREKAFKLLFEAAAERDSLNYVKTDPRLDALHSDARWPELLRQMNLPTALNRGAATSHQLINER